MNDQEIAQLLSTARTIAVVGLSGNPDRPSFGVAQYLQSKGYRIIPVNPTIDSVFGEKSYASLSEIPEKVDVKVDIVDVFRRSEFVPALAEEAIAIGARCLWLQLGVIHEEAARRARDAGLLVVMDRCLAVERLRLAG
jgi:predicted CoA-binding protein